MQFHLDARQRGLQAEARAFARDVVAPGAAERDRTKEFPTEIIERAGHHGYMGFLVPLKYGGNGLGNVSQGVILEEIAAACASTHVTLSVHNSLICSPIHSFGSEELRWRYLPKVATGEWLGAYLLTEPDSGSDAAAMKTTAVEDGDHWVINGEKMWITSADLARIGIVFARTKNAPDVKSSRSISAFVAHFDDPGVTFGKREPKLGLRASSTVSVQLENVRVPKENMLGELHRGFHIAMDMLNGGRIGIAIQAIGIARSALETALAAVRELKRGGRPLAKSQLVSFRLSEIAAELDAARLLAMRAAALRDGKVPHIREASMAKLFATQVANRAVRDIVSLLGEAGYGDGSTVERLMRDIRVCELYEGTTEIQKLVIAKQLLED